MFKDIKNKNIDIDKIKTNTRLPQKNKGVFIVNDFENPILSVILEMNKNENITDLYGCFYRISQKQLKIFEQLKEKNNCEKFNLILSDSIPQMIVGTYNYLKENENFNVNYINTHSKFCIIKTSENYYAIISSGNSNPDGKIEQISIFNKESIYLNMKNFCEDIKKRLKI